MGSMTTPTPRPPAGTVAVPQLALVMLSAALLAAVLVIALLSFQLGRETARANQVVENGSPEAPNGRRRRAAFAGPRAP